MMNTETHKLVVGGRCKADRHTILSESDLYREPSTGNIRCARCWRANRNRARKNQRTIQLIEPNIEVVPLSKVPPPLTSRVEPDTWERAVLRAKLLRRDEALRITGVGVRCESSIRDAARKVGVPVAVVQRDGAIWLMRREGR